ncbi:hypothetical protein [Phytohabitans rumicis]|uniref:Uncharacterized protein n=1 Tax=Phytohabitans rumicis TaxID=1076125 RepID=A0A6V8L876_9ACTN|nr:hypothetical protein [Phytohabitans rumicis]GFJ92484.1 hypothetical protein Prum_061260 [Phytohabitans rumicis]
MSTILGTPPAEPGPARKPRRGDAERILAGELLDAFRASAQTHTEFMARLHGMVVNDVLAVETVALDADGRIFRQWHVAAGAAEICNLSTEEVTVTASGPASGPPTGGVGVSVVPAGAIRIVNLGSRQMTIYGTATDRVSFQVVTRGGILGSTIGAIDGGAP